MPEGAAAARDPPTQWATSVQIWLNGEAITIENPDPKTTLLEWLREDRCVRSNSPVRHRSLFVDRTRQRLRAVSTALS